MLKKYLRRSVRSFMWAAVLHVLLTLVLVPLFLLFLLKSSEGNGPGLTEVVPVLTTVLYILLMPLTLTEGYIIFNRPPTFSLEFILQKYRETYHDPVSALLFSDDSIEYLEIVQPNAVKRKFRIYSDLYCDEIYQGVRVKTQASRFITKNLKSSIFGYEYE